MNPAGSCTDASAYRSRVLPIEVPIPQLGFVDESGQLNLSLMEDVSEEEKKWNELARTKGYRCESCDQPIAFDEREIFRARKLCYWCATLEGQDD